MGGSKKRGRRGGESGGVTIAISNDYNAVNVLVQYRGFPQSCNSKAKTGSDSRQMIGQLHHILVM